MTKKTKLIGSASGMLAVAAFTGLLAGATHVAGAKTLSAAVKAQTGVAAKVLRLDGNDCKGKGGCKTATAPSAL